MHTETYDVRVRLYLHRAETYFRHADELVEESRQLDAHVHPCKILDLVREAAELRKRGTQEARAAYAALGLYYQPPSVGSTPNPPQQPSWAA